MRRFVLILYGIFLISSGLNQEMNRQEAPTFVLNAMVLSQDSPLILEGSHLAPDAVYSLNLTSPRGELVLEETLTSSPEGMVRFNRTLGEPGLWLLAIRGQDARAIFEIEVNEALTEALGSEVIAEPAEVTEPVTEIVITTESSLEPESESSESLTTGSMEAVSESGEEALSAVVSELQQADESISESLESAEAGAEAEMAVESDTLVDLLGGVEAVAEVLPEPIEAGSPDVAVELAPEETVIEEAITEEAIVVEEALAEEGVATSVTPEVASEASTVAVITETENVEEAGNQEVINEEAETEAIAVETPLIAESDITETAALTEEAVPEPAPVEQEALEAETSALAEMTETSVSESSALEPETNLPLGLAQTVLDPAKVEVSLEATGVIARVAAEPVWQLDFPADSGETSALYPAESSSYVAHGNSLLELDNATGKVLKRWILSGPIKQISGSKDHLTILTQVETVTESFNLINGELQEVVRFAGQPELYNWLKNEAELANPAARLEQDPTNPWLHLKAAEQGDQAAYSAALEAGQTFYDLAGLARAFLDAGQQDLAYRAMDKAMIDFAQRGYDPRLLRDLNLHEAYHFPLRPLELALLAKDREKADFWAHWLKYFVSPDLPKISETLRGYANLVAKEDGRAAAKDWRMFSDAGRRSNAAMVLDNFFAILGRTGWYGVLSLLLAIVGLHLTLLFKYWAPQSLFIRRRKAINRSSGPMPRLFVMRYYSFFEKLVLVLLFAAALLMAGLATWNNVPKTLSITTGSFDAASLAGIGSLDLAGERGSFIKGYAAQVAANTSEATAYYQAADSVAGALNNLAALTANPALYDSALRLSPTMPEAKYNSGQELNAFWFHKDYLPQQAVLAVPSQEDIQVAVSGSWQAAVIRTFSNPWSALQKANPFPDWGGARLPWLSQYLWYLVMVVFFLWAAITLVWLLFPRPRLARNAPRNPLYQFFALLIPGSGAADEMWGLLLLIPWAIVGLDTLADIFGWGFGIGLSRRWDYIILAIIYAINLVAVIVEFISYSSRMKALKRDNEELAREFRLIR